MVPHTIVGNSRHDWQLTCQAKSHIGECLHHSSKAPPREQRLLCFTNRVSIAQLIFALEETFRNASVFHSSAKHPRLPGSQTTAMHNSCYGWRIWSLTTAQERIHVIVLSILQTALMSLPSPQQSVHTYQVRLQESLLNKHKNIYPC